jgi:hypothetical protein
MGGKCENSQQPISLLRSSHFHRQLLRKGSNRNQQAANPSAKFPAKSGAVFEYAQRIFAKTYVSLNARVTADWLALREEPVLRNISCATV